MHTPSSFDFRSFTVREDSHTIDFVYALDETTITETLRINTKNPIPNTPLVRSILFSLHLMLGISYYKAFCPRDIRVSSGTLTKAQAEFWNTVYTKGLGQFFFENQIDFDGLCVFPATKGAMPVQSLATKNDTVLLPLGGGKDSLVTSTLLKKHQIPFDLFVLGSHAALEPQLSHINTTLEQVTREIDPQLFAWNQAGALNGHIPISAIYGWVALLVAAIDEYQYIILSNESSANEPNVQYKGLSVNHQWSKSLEYETLFQEYVQKYITPDITYFSLLRPYSEGMITELFAKHCTPFFDLFTSCNQNFAITKKATERWCGACPKCAFVFALLAAQLKKETMLRIFGKNLYEDASLSDLFRELLGIKNFKPFECVGTPHEVMLAMHTAHISGEYEHTPIMNIFIQEVLPQMPNIETLQQEIHTLGQHRIPQAFQHIIYGLE